MFVINIILSCLLPVSCWAGGAAILRKLRGFSNHPVYLEMNLHKFYISSDPHPTAVETTHTPILACTTYSMKSMSMIDFTTNIKKIPKTSAANQLHVIWLSFGVREAVF